MAAVTQVNPVATDVFFDALVICDARDYFTGDPQRIIDKDDTKLCFIYDGKEPGMSLCRNVGEMRTKCRFIIFYITEHFCENKELIHVTECLAKPEVEHNLISLVTVDNFRICDKFLWLAKFVIYKSSEDWRSKLIRELLPAYQPIFFKALLPENIRTFLHHQGFSLSRLKWNMEGVMVEIVEQILKIDLECFEQHLKDHKKYQINVKFVANVLNCALSILRL